MDIQANENSFFDWNLKFLSSVGPTHTTWLLRRCHAGLVGKWEPVPGILASLGWSKFTATAVVLAKVKIWNQSEIYIFIKICDSS